MINQITAKSNLISPCNQLQVFAWYSQERVHEYTQCWQERDHDTSRENKLGV